MNISKKNIFIICAIFVFSLAYSVINFSDAKAAFSTPTCGGGDGCNFSCYAADPDCTPATCSIAGSGGFIPCGKSCDDPDTAWDERSACNLCSLFLMGQLVIEFMVKLSGIAALVAIAIGGFMYVFAAGSTSAIEKAKSMIKYTLLGFVVVFVAWAIIDSILATAGYIDPLTGDWYVMECSS